MRYTHSEVKAWRLKQVQANLPAKNKDFLTAHGLGKCCLCSVESLDLNPTVYDTEAVCSSCLRGDKPKATKQDIDNLWLILKGELNQMTQAAEERYLDKIDPDKDYSVTSLRTSGNPNTSVVQGFLEGVGQNFLPDPQKQKQKRLKRRDQITESIEHNYTKYNKGK